MRGCAGCRTCVRTATDASDDGKVIQTTATRRALADPITKERTTPEFCAYIEALTPEAWQRHRSNSGDGVTDVSTSFLK
jgi:hypothetical protein